MASPVERAYRNFRAGEAAFRDANRFRQILSILARHGFGAVLQGLQLDERWLLRKILELRSTELERLPIERRIVLAIHELGPTFVKLGQILSTRGDLLPEPLVEELKSLQDDVPPIPAEAVHRIIREELGDEADSHFDDFEIEPLACASIAQVHRARLKDSGEEVVVKVQRPHIEERIEADLEIMAFLARQLEANFSEAKLYSPMGMVEEFAAGVRREVDFSVEVENIERFRRNFAGNLAVHFPAPHRRLCARRVLTMECVTGTKITAITPQQADVQTVLRAGLEAVMQMILSDGFFHGDLHPGNLLVRDDGVLCFLDFGLCGRLTPRQRDLLVDMLTALVSSDFAAVSRVFWKLAIRSPGSTHDYDAFEADVVECLERQFAGKTMAEIEISSFFRDLVRMAIAHHVRIPADYTMTFKALVTLEGVAKQLMPELDLLSAMRPYVTSLIAERYSPRRLTLGALEALRELSDTAGDLPAKLNDILDDLHAGRTRFQVEIAGLEELRRSGSAAQQRQTLTAIAATAALCGTLALDYGAPTAVGVPVVTACFYAVSILLGGWLLLSRPHR